MRKCPICNREVVHLEKHLKNCVVLPIEEYYYVSGSDVIDKFLENLKANTPISIKKVTTDLILEKNPKISIIHYQHQLIEEVKVLCDEMVNFILDKWREGDIEPIIETDKQQFYLNKMKNAKDIWAVFDLMAEDDSNDNDDLYDYFDEAKWRLSNK